MLLPVNKGKETAGNDIFIITAPMSKRIQKQMTSGKERLNFILFFLKYWRLLPTGNPTYIKHTSNTHQIHKTYTLNTNKTLTQIDINNSHHNLQQI